MIMISLNAVKALHPVEPKKHSYQLGTSWGFQLLEGKNQADHSPGSPKLSTCDEDTFCL